MMTKGGLSILNELASMQWGLFTSAQAKRYGISRQQLSRYSSKDQIERLAFGVYKVRGASINPHQDIQVAWLSVDPDKLLTERQNERETGIVVGGHTAAYLYGVGDLWATPYLFITHRRKQSQRPEIIFRTRKLLPEDVTMIEGMPVTGPEYTLATLAAEGEDMAHISDAAFHLSRKVTLDQDKLSDLLAPHARAYGFSSTDGQSFAQVLFTHAAQVLAKEFIATYGTEAHKLLQKHES